VSSAENKFKNLGEAWPLMAFFAQRNQGRWLIPGRSSGANLPGNFADRQNSLWSQLFFLTSLLSLKPTPLPKKISHPMTSDHTLSPVQKRAQDISQEIIQKRASLREIEWRLGTALEKPGDFEEVRRLAHALGGLAQETKLASYLLERKSAGKVTPNEEIKRKKAPNFDDDAIQWLGRTI
jgi:hypothetical protein